MTRRILDLHRLIPALCLTGFTAAYADNGKLLYAPDLQAQPIEEAGYPRLIRLAHSGDSNGVLLATFAQAGGTLKKGGLPIFRSTDNGATFSRTPISTVTDTVHGWDIEAPALFELPISQGELPAGTLFAAGTAWNRRDFRQQSMMVYISQDHGVSWSYRSACVSESLQVNNEGHGIWEPQFAITADGSLNCFFSDERPSAEGFAQIIAHVRSTDGGASWSTEIVDVASRDGSQRPGMPTVLRLPNGSYAMTLEDCKAGQDPDQVCTDYLKVSPDGQDWTPLSSMGTPIAASNGHRLLHTPSLAWSPYGGPNGTLIAAGQRVFTGEEGAIHLESSTGRVVMVNMHLGAGSWQEIAAPLLIDPTGGYDTGEIACPGYSSSLLAPTQATDSSFMMMSGTANGAGNCEIRYAAGKLPRADR
jgi:BNR repeat-like domain